MRVRERGGGAARARAAGAADAMDEVFGHLRQVVIHHVRDALHVDAAGGHVGGHQDAIVAVLKALERLVALILAAVAVDGGGLRAAERELLRQPVGAVLGAGEDQERAGLGLQHGFEQRQLLVCVDFVEAQVDLLHRAA